MSLRTCARAAAPLIALCALSPTGSFGQTVPTIETVTVTAARRPAALADIPESVSVVTARQIADTPAQGLDDILRDMPGMVLNDIGPDVGHPTTYNESMRGLPTTETRMLVMVDGVPINDPFFGYIQWNRIPLDDIDRVEIVRGGGSPLWGNTAMGGVVNIITRTPGTEALDAAAAGGSYGSYNTSLYGAHAAADWATLSLNAAATGTDGYQTTPASWTSYGTLNLRSPVYTATSMAAQNVGLRADFAPSPDLTGFININYNGDQQILATPIGLDRQDVWTYAGQIRKAFGDDTSLTLTWFHDDSNFITDNPHLLTFTTEYNSNVHTTDASDNGGSLVAAHETSGFLRNVELGADFHQVSGSDDANYFAPSGRLEAPTIVGGGDQIFLAGFAQVQLVPIERLEIMASLRYQYYRSFDGIDTFPPGFGTIPAYDKYRSTPRLDARYAIDDRFALRAAWYQSFRAPTLDELYRTYADTTAGIYEGNPLLLPETMEGEEAGVDYTLPGLRSQFTLYNSTIANLITQYNLPPSQYPDLPGVTCGYDASTYTYLSCTRNINAAAAIARGFEAEIDWNIGGGFSSETTYTYADSRYTANAVDPTAVGEPLEGVPRHNAGEGITYAAPSGWQASAILRYISASYGDAHPADGLVQNAHFVVDVSGSYPLTEQLQAYAQIQNLFDQRYIASNSGAAPILGTPFEAMGGLRVKLQ